MSEQEKCCCSIDYEAAYEEYLSKYHQLLEKYAALEAECKFLCEQRRVLEAQMEVVRLIFGGDGK